VACLRIVTARYRLSEHKIQKPRYGTKVKLEVVSDVLSLSLKNVFAIIKMYLPTNQQVGNLIFNKNMWKPYTVLCIFPYFVNTKKYSGANIRKSIIFIFLWLTYYYIRFPEKMKVALNHQGAKNNYYPSSVSALSLSRKALSSRSIQETQHDFTIQYNMYILLTGG